MHLSGWMHFAMNKAGYYYLGSMPEPNCDEPVHWIIGQKLQTCSPEQIALFSKRINENTRMEMPKNGRQVYDCRLG